MKRGFTLIEVTLAMMIMAIGVLAVVGLYAYGFRESSQSREDVVTSAVADSVMSPLVAALSSDEIPWNTFKNIPNVPGDRGWWEYLDDDGEVSTGAKGLAQSAFQKVMAVCSAADVTGTYPVSDLSAADLTGALIILHKQGSPVVGIGFRAVKTKAWKHLMASPVYFTEVRFQGKQDSANN